MGSFFLHASAYAYAYVAAVFTYTFAYAYACADALVKTSLTMSVKSRISSRPTMFSSCLLADTVGQIKRANETSAEQQMTKIKNWHTTNRTSTEGGLMRTNASLTVRSRRQMTAPRLLRGHLLFSRQDQVWSRRRWEIYRWRTKAHPSCWQVRIRLERGRRIQTARFSWWFRNDSTVQKGAPAQQFLVARRRLLQGLPARDASPVRGPSFVS